MSSEALAHVRRMLEAEPFAVRRYARTQLLEGMRALLAEVARLEQERNEAERESSAQMSAKLEAQMALAAITEGLDLRLADLGNGWTEGAVKILARIETIVDEGERGFAALAVAREREQRAVRLLADAMYQLQIADPVRWRLLRQNQAASGVDEPAAATKGEVGAVCDAFIDWMDSVGYNSIEAAEIVASCRAAATLAKPGRAESRPLGLNAESGSRSDHSPGSASAAADEPARKRPAGSDGMGRTPPGGRATQDPEIGASTRAAADEPSARRAPPERNPECVECNEDEFYSQPEWAADGVTPCHRVGTAAIKCPVPAVYVPAAADEPGETP